jgi:peptidoglycan hydrolase-like protein with peptidoglycan-binding domain
MALRSNLFQGDTRLESCAVADSAHVTLGAKGPFVERIQQALIYLDGSAYQTQADDIVGKITVAALDQELFERQKTVKLGGRHCHRSCPSETE